ncbi:anthrone oxygenase family protein [[Actinomadura] parvosata]|uniref:DUF1772 domain-containing protein n=2 Tax=Nonomuraea TaxID=83681 RepID=A0A1V0A102_9ACTN|nr:MULTISPECIES: DUF1772 domain-containing protein [unclassified Nonomuraea]AQZ63896.1 hypothetical protein BKM31_22710 [Nonomuraea sp. ATCC 55076]NJP95645.1 DUF1772 domain-containing protein [Nonomuraea sp. FMUSA5-5]
MVTELLSVAALVGSGVVAGVLFAVALSVLPALIAMPADRYVYTHQLVGRRWDPTMPIIVLTSTVIDIVLALLTSAATALLFATAAVLLLGVSVVSHFCNVPINRVVKSLDPAEVPPDWRDPRPLWRRWHLLRTTLALLGVTANALAVVLA